MLTIPILCVTQNFLSFYLDEQNMFVFESTQCEATWRGSVLNIVDRAFYSRDYFISISEKIITAFMNFLKIAWLPGSAIQENKLVYFYYLLIYI